MFEKVSDDIYRATIQKLANLIKQAEGDNGDTPHGHVNPGSRYYPLPKEYREVENSERFIPPEMESRPWDYSHEHADYTNNKEVKDMTPYELAQALAFEDKYYSPMTTPDAIPHPAIKDYTYPRGFAGEKVGIPEHTANTALRAASGFNIPSAGKETHDQISGRKTAPIQEKLMDLADKAETEGVDPNVLKPLSTLGFELDPYIIDNQDMYDGKFSYPASDVRFNNPSKPSILLRDKPKYKMQLGRETYTTQYPVLNKPSVTDFGHYRDIGEEGIRNNYKKYREGEYRSTYDINQLLREAYGFTRKE